ncbi:MAG: hypothetical protein QXV37_04685 [Candidatus Jordarchaeaceae archaeon]
MGEINKNDTSLIFPFDNRQNEVKLEIYADESFTTVNPKWLYLGVIFIPTNKKEESLNKLYDLRCLQKNSWHDNIMECNCGHHDENNKEIHYGKIKLNSQLKISKRWIENFLMEYCVRNKALYLNILGIDLQKLDMKNFGKQKKQYISIYNRFFRTAVIGGLKYFFDDIHRVKVVRILHDYDQQKDSPLFRSHIIKKMKENLINVVSPELELIDSDHQKSGKKESNFIQLIDIILGAVQSCFHHVSNLQKRALGQSFLPCLKILVNRGDGGLYYRSQYYRRFQISFFPKSSISRIPYKNLDLFENEIENQLANNNQFYYNRPITLKHPSPYSLENWGVKINDA